MDNTLMIQLMIIAIAILSGILYVLWRIKKQGLRKTTTEFIVYAEKHFKDNQEKFDYCVTQLTKIIPYPFNLIITNDMVKKIVQSTFDIVKQALDYREEN